MNPTGSPRSLRAMHRFSAFFVALLWSVAPVLAVVHAGAETHRYCAEHDALEEGESEGETSSSRDSNPAVSGSESSSPHEACAFARYCRFGQVLGQFAWAATGEIEGRRLETPVPVEPAASVAVIVFAPKTSPPV